MKFKELNIQGVFEVELTSFADERGALIKPFHKETFQERGLESDFKENFFTINKKGVLRGMHFQLPPHDQAKLVYVVSGEILDVLLDLRKNSPTYGKHIKLQLSKENNKAIYIPKGIAHGYYCVTEATVVYLTSTVFNGEFDDGISYHSFGCDWPKDDFILSEKDKNLVDFKNYSSLF